MTARRALLIALLLCAGVLVAAALVADVRSLRAAMIGYPFAVLAPVCALVLGNYALRTVRFRAYLRRLEVRLPWTEGFLVFTAGFVFTVSPGKMGEIFKGFLLRQRRGVPVADTATVVVAERFTDVVGLLGLAAAGVLEYGAHPALFLSVLALCASFLLAVAHPRLVPALLRLFHPWAARRGWSAGLLATVGRIHGVLRVLVAPRPLLLGTALAAAAWFLECVAFRLLLDGAGATGTLGAAIVVYAMATLFGAVSMLPGGVGTTEAVMVALLLQPALGLHLDLPRATLVTLLIRFATLWFGVGMGGLALLALRKVPVSEPEGAPPPAA